MKNQHLGKQLPHQVLEIYRFRALELRKKGKKVKEIAEFFGIHPNSVSRWFVIKNKQGKKALKSKKAPGPEMKLNEKEMKILLQLLKESGLHFGFETPLWTCKRVCYLIQKKMKKKLHISNGWRLLKRLGLSNQKPERRAMQQNPREAKRWLQEDWPKIQTHARRWQAMLYFHDESGISLTPNLGKTWAPKGKTPIIRITGKRGGFCVTSAISPAGRLVFRLEKGKVNADKTIEFFTQIRAQHRNRKIIVVTDQARPHTAAKVAKFVEQHKKSFALYYLPSYSPELNPDEKVWAHLKGAKLQTHQAKTTPELRRLTFGAMKSIQMQPSLVQSFFYNLT
jgi:transposase